MGKREILRSIHERVSKLENGDEKETHQSIHENQSSFGGFSTKGKWDEFYSTRQQLDQPYEWYAESTQLNQLILSHFSLIFPATSQILVPGCGNSRLSEHLYDAGFQSITNIDYSKVAISNMSRRNARVRPYMRWRVMDMTNIQFMNESFDAVVDKGGLDALLEAKDGAMLANQYLSEVERVTKTGGKFICFTFGEPHVLDVLLPKVRRGWKTNIIEIPVIDSSTKPSFPSFMLSIEKTDDVTVFGHLLEPPPSLSPLALNDKQISEFLEAIKKENEIRKENKNGKDINEGLKVLVNGDCLFEATADQKVADEFIKYPKMMTV